MWPEVCGLPSPGTTETLPFWAGGLETAAQIVTSLAGMDHASHGLQVRGTGKKEEGRKEGSVGLQGSFPLLQTGSRVAWPQHPY